MEAVILLLCQVRDGGVEEGGGVRWTEVSQQGGDELEADKRSN